MATKQVTFNTTKSGNHWEYAHPGTFSVAFLGRADSRDESLRESAFCARTLYVWTCGWVVVFAGTCFDRASFFPILEPPKVAVSKDATSQLQLLRGKSNDPSLRLVEKEKGNTAISWTGSESPFLHSHSALPTKKLLSWDGALFSRQRNWSRPERRSPDVQRRGDRPHSPKTSTLRSPWQNRGFLQTP